VPPLPHVSPTPANAICCYRKASISSCKFTPPPSGGLPVMFRVRSVGLPTLLFPRNFPSSLVAHRLAPRGLWSPPLVIRSCPINISAPFFFVSSDLLALFIRRTRFFVVMTDRRLLVCPWAPDCVVQLACSPLLYAFFESPGSPPVHRPFHLSTLTESHPRLLFTHLPLSVCRPPH